MSTDRYDMPPARATTRFHQIAEFEAQLRSLEDRIDARKSDIKSLKDQYDGVLEQLFAAARDEGELPLFPFGFADEGEVSS